MADSINPQHPLVRDGRSQTERLDLHALAPESVALDDRSERQLLVYLNEFAKAVAFYETDESPDKKLQQSNWQPFFRTSSSVQVSLIEAFDITNYETGYTHTKQRFTDGLNRANYAPWFDFLFDSALTVNSWFVALSGDVVLLENKVILNETPLRRLIEDLIQSNLQPALSQLFSVVNLPDITYQLPNLTDLAKEQVGSLWNLGSIQYIRDNTLTDLDSVVQIRRIADRLDDIFRTFAKTIQQIVGEAAKQDILQPTQTHEPHLALLYTFLRLLRRVTDDFNGLTQKHLDFYYRDVLKLQPKLLVPDAVHVLFELPKPVSQYRLPQQTLLKDGKDAHKVDVHFALDDEIIISQTQIAELRTLYRNATSFLARPKANSADGLGKDFADPAHTKWAILGEEASENPPNDKTKKALAATVGLAISSKELILSAGLRTITLTLTCENPVPANATDAFAIRLSGAKKWFSPSGVVTTLINGHTLSVMFTLGVKDDAIVAADPAVLGVDYGITNEAVIQLILNDKAGLYELMRLVQIKAVSIKTEVSQLQNVLIRTDDGDQDPTKPFMPFGAVPSVGSTFSIGSPEIFSKELTKLEVDFEWDKKPSDFGTYYGAYKLTTVPLPTTDNSFTRRVFYYEKGNPVNEETSPGNVFEPLILSADSTGNDFTADSISLPIPTSPAVAKEAGWQDGFVLVQLQNDFLHQYYAEVLTRNALLLSNKTPDQLKDIVKEFPATTLTVNPPYTPVIKNLTVSYTAETSAATLFHVLPFDDGANYRRIEQGAKSVPFVVDNFSDQGALLIGLTNAVEGSLTLVLFQLLESSAKTNIDAATIHWTYLDGNDWLPLEAGKNVVNDATKGFIQSGIVQLVLPERTASRKTTVLPSSFYWIKAATSDNIQAVCKAVGVHTQASRATFAPVLADEPAKQNDPARLAVPLPAGLVTKLDTPDVSIKAIKQPYPSFGGRPAESTSHFYSRVSEQLRHKGRGVTLFDYEQLILEAFPEVFKVKCIPHTFANRSVDPTNQAINDVHAAPGYVTVVVVPDAMQTQLDDLQKPMASRGLLTRIQDWIKKRISPFARLQVLNPIYEEVDTQFQVQFCPGKSREYYIELLKKDIGQFLAPWAFDSKAQVTFGGVIYRSSILGFIENREYVAFVTDFVMQLDGVQQEEVHASAARVVFTNGKHTITPFTAKPPPRLVNRGIGSPDWQIPSSSSKTP
ncbi:baseplate J/gp47 family protein [Spirosoma validum]|uniref:Baseplate J/gp47 family protein n=1 Tax=Spirosoma validum TaxID=2771355 RepID=A0A927B0L7_9BACT|nr:baseplate J/gp47 family protein [Spirosoma validum]MBD2753194.1 baseplate J/gp47 family protein [Spirosoma validum]